MDCEKYILAIECRLLNYTDVVDQRKLQCISFYRIVGVYLNFFLYPRSLREIKMHPLPIP